LPNQRAAALALALAKLFSIPTSEIDTASAFRTMWEFEKKVALARH